MRFRPGLLHLVIHLAFLVFMIIVGVQFTLFALWAMGITEFFVPRPPAVEGFLPISAMLAAKRFFLTGLWDPVHPAGLTIFLFAIASALFLRKGFCGYVCPGGAICHLIFLAGRRLNITRTPSPRFYWLWTIPKYLLLAFFLYIASMDVETIEFFLRSPYNMVCDTKMLLFFMHPSGSLLAVLLVAVSGSLLFPSFWCRCLCPYGALLGIFSLFSPMAVRRDTTSCVNCGRCTRACPQGIAVHLKQRVNLPECTGCMECVSACPKQHCLSAGFGWNRSHPKRRSIPWWGMAALTVLTLAGFYLWARASGHWQTIIPTEMVRMLHMGIESLGHY